MSQFLTGASYISTSLNSYTGYFLLSDGWIEGPTTETDADAVCRNAGDVSNLRLHVSTNGRSTNCTSTFYKNGSSTSLTVTATASTTGVFEDTSNTVTLSAADTWSCDFSTSTGGGSIFIRVLSVLWTGLKKLTTTIEFGTGGSSGTGSTTRYWMPAGIAYDNGTESICQAVIPEDCTYSDLMVNVVSNSNTGTCTYASRVNGGAGNCSVSVTTTSTGYYEDTSNSDSITSGDLFCYQLSRGGSGNIRFNTLGGCFECTGGFMMFNGTGANGQANPTTYWWIMGYAAQSTSESSTQWDNPMETDVSLLSVRVISNSSSSTVTMTTRINGADGNQTLSLTGSTTGNYQDTSNSDTLTDGDLICYRGTGANNFIYYSCIAMFVDDLDPGAAAYTITAGSGAYAVTGTAANLEQGAVVSAAAGAYTMTGTAAGFLYSPVLGVESGSYTMTGTAANLVTGVSLSAEAGAYTVSGSDAGFLRDIILTAEAGSYAVTGGDVALTPTLLGFCDDFNRANENLEASANWTRVDGSAGDTSISGNLLVSNTTSTTGGAYQCPDIGSGDKYVECTVPAARNAFGACMRLTDTNNFIGCRYQSGAYQVYKRDAGSFTLLASYTASLDTSHVLRLEMRGDDFEMFVNGVSRATFTDTFNNTETRQGVVGRSQTGSFCDNFCAGVLTATEYTVSAEAGAYTISGTTVNLSYVAEVAADGGAYTITGTAVNLDADFLLGAAAGSYAITGTDANLEAAVVLAAAGGAYTLTGSDVGLGRLITIGAEGGSYAITGQDVSLLLLATVSAQGGAYTITGQDVGFTADLLIGAEGGAYSITGSDVSLVVATTVTAEAGSYTMTGTDAGLVLDASISAEGGAYLVTGKDAGLNYGSNISLTAEGGTYEITGQPVGLIQQSGVVAQPGSYTVSGQDVGLSAARVLAAQPGAYVWDGKDVNLTFTASDVQNLPDLDIFGLSMKLGFR